MYNFFGNIKYVIQTYQQEKNENKTFTIILRSSYNIRNVNAVLEYNNSM